MNRVDSDFFSFELRFKNETNQIRMHFHENFQEKKSQFKLSKSFF